MLHHIQQLQDGQNVFVNEEKISMIILNLTDENIELVRQVITNDPHSTYDEIITETCLSLSLMVQ